MENFKKVTKVVSIAILLVFALIGYSIFKTFPVIGLIVFGAVIIGIFPVAVNLLLKLGKRWLAGHEQKRKKLHKQAGNELLIKGYYDNHELYTKTKTLFGNLIKNRRMSREQILKFESMLNDDLGCFAKEYRKLEREGKIKFHNDAHRIYFKLKSPYLTSVNFNELYAYLDEIKKQNV